MASTVLKGFAGLTKREILAFKAGSWSSLPIDFVIENYGIPFAKKHFGEKAFYMRIKNKPKRYGGRRRTRRRLMDDPMIISQTESETPVRAVARSVGTQTPLSKHRKIRPSGHYSTMEERKTHFLDATNLLLDVGTMESQQLYNLPQGVKLGDRIGARVRAHSIRINGSIRNRITSIPVCLRVLIVHDKRPQLGDVKQNFFQSKTTANEPHNYVTTGDYTQVIEPVNSNRYRVLSDRRFKLAPTTSANLGKENALINYHVKVNRFFKYLTESTLSDTEKICPNMYILYFVENQTSTTGVGTCEVKLNVYETFTG